MALTLTEIQKIINGIPKPADTSLRNLVGLAGIRHYRWFEANQKATDPETLARGYVDKMLSTTRQLVTGSIPTAKTATLSLVVVAGSTLNYGNVLEYNTSDWESLVENNIVSALELTAGITTAEKQAYDGL